MSDANLSGLGASFRAAMAEIENAQSSANLTIDRCNEAGRQLGLTAEGSTSELVSNALANLAEATLAVEGVIAQLVASKTDIEQHVAAKGI